ncbi:MAG TPA: hypothetical protein GXZ74_01430 [Tissierellia bacterium]|nr:hypothetical protein [Tissierellia bacterium]
MLLIDTYLQSFDLKRYDVAKRSGISQQVLSNARNKPALQLPMSVVSAIAKSVAKTPGAVLDELIALENEGRTYMAKDYERLLIGLENQEEYIIISGPFVDEIRPVIEAQLSSLSKDILEFGFRGMMPLVSLIRQGFTKLTGRDTDEQRLQERLMNYEILISAKDEIILQDRRAQY